MNRLCMISDVSSGGAAIACGRLSEALRREGGWEVTWIAATGEQRGGALIADRWAPLSRIAMHRLSVFAGGDGLAATRAWRAMNEAATLRLVAKLRPDLLHLHNLHDSFRFGIVRRLPSRVPLVWTLHDMWPLTGYCCYDMGCGKFADGCLGECPEAGRCGPAAGTAAHEWRRRERFYARHASRMAFVCPSRWMVRQAERRFGNRMRVEWIPNSVNTEVFAPIPDRRAVRRALGLPEEGAIILAGAHWAGDPRKGNNFIRAAWQEWRRWIGGPCTLVLFGQQLRQDEVLPEWRHVGLVRDEKMMNLLYNAADVFVLPTLADNLPNTLVESLAAGTPCVAHDVGGCSDVVREGVTGKLVPVGNGERLVASVRDLLSLSISEREGFQRRCREAAEREYAPALQARRHKELYEELIAREQAGVEKA